MTNGSEHRRSGVSGLRGALIVAVVAASAGGLGAALATAGSTSDPNGIAGELRYVESHFEGAPGGGNWNNHNAHCPNRRHVTGGGYDVGAFDAGVNVHDSGPLDDEDANSIRDDGWRVQASVAENSTLDVTAICDK